MLGGGGLPYPSAVVSQRSSFGSKTSCTSNPSGTRSNTTTSGALEGARTTSPRVPSIGLVRELPSPKTDVRVAICGSAVVRSCFSGWDWLTMADMVPVLRKMGLRRSQLCFSPSGLMFRQDHDECKCS